MLTTMNEVLKIAEARNIAVGAFDTPNLENMFAVVKTAEKYNVPVILMYIPLLEDVAPLEFMAPVMVAVARNAKVPVVVHLDHCGDLECLNRCLELGFTSVMYDGSELSYEDNVRNTKIAVEYARRYGADVEAEIGIMGGREAGGANVGNIKPEDMYTDPEDARRFVEETQIDALAASFGTSHGFYTVAPKLDFARIEKIKSLVKIPLVMHGGSGVNEEDYIKAIHCGIRKINYYSYMGKAGVEGVKSCLENCNGEVAFYHEIAAAATEKMQENVEKAIRTFSMKS